MTLKLQDDNLFRRITLELSDTAYKFFIPKLNRKKNFLSRPDKIETRGARFNNFLIFKRYDRTIINQDIKGALFFRGRGKIGLIN
jgi:hypothetical protein